MNYDEYQNQYSTHPRRVYLILGVCQFDFDPMKIFIQLSVNRYKYTFFLN